MLPGYSVSSLEAFLGVGLTEKTLGGRSVPGLQPFCCNGYSRAEEERKELADATKELLLQGWQRRKPPSHLLEAREAYLALEAWGWAADGHQGSGPGPDGPLWTSSSSASCRSHSREWPLGHRSARGTGSHGASAAGCQPSHGSTLQPSRGSRAGPVATPGHPETPQPWWGTQVSF